MNWIERREARHKPIRIVSRSTRNGVRRFEVTSSSDARRHYVVTIANGKGTCSCKGWIFPRKVKVNGKIVKLRKACRHIKKLMAGSCGEPR